MEMFNADGSEGKTCGNALRCIGNQCKNETLGKWIFRKNSNISGHYLQKSQIAQTKYIKVKVCIS